MGFSPRLCRLCDLTLRDWIEVISGPCANAHRSVYSAWITISCTECECYIFSKQNWVSLSYRRLYSLMYPRCHKEQTYYSAEAECEGLWLWRSFNISDVSSHQRTHQKFSYFHNNGTFVSSK